jgi:hypothetical protein
MAEQRTLSREDFQSDKAKTVGVEPVDIPELGGVVYVRGTSGKGRDAFEAWALSDKGQRNIRGKAAARACSDKAGNRLFSDQDAGWLGDLDVRILQKIFVAFQRTTGVSKEDVDELEQGSAANPGGDSSSN